MLEVDSAMGRVCRSSCTAGTMFESYDETDPTKVYDASTGMVNGMGTTPGWNCFGVELFRTVSVSTRYYLTIK